MASRCVVFGDDDAQRLVARELARTGHHVVLWQAPDDAGPCGPSAVGRAGEHGVEDASVASLAGVTSDPFEALGAADVLIGRASSDGLSAVADQVLPLLEPRHTLVLLGGGLHVLAAAKWLGDRGRGGGATLVASDTMPFAERSGRECLEHADLLPVHAGFGVFPALRTETTMASLTDLFPAAKAHANVLAAALATIEPMLSSALLLMNLGAAERSACGCPALENGFTPSVARVAEALDGERLALAAALGLDLARAADALHAWGVSPLGDLWAAVSGSLVLRHSLGVSSSRVRRLAADAGYWLRPWAELADQFEVPAPSIHSLVTLCDVAVGAGSRDAGWSLEDLGISGTTGGALRHVLMTGGPAL